MSDAVGVTLKQGPGASVLHVWVVMRCEMLVWGAFLCENLKEASLERVEVLYAMMGRSFIRRRLVPHGVMLADVFFLPTVVCRFEGNMEELRVPDVELQDIWSAKVLGQILLLTIRVASFVLAFTCAKVESA